MVDKVDRIWMEGELIDWDKANVHVLTHSLHYGLGAFEGIRAYHRHDGVTAIFRLYEHIDRLLGSCKLCMIKPRFGREELAKACVDLLRSNRMQEAYIRPLVYMGDGAMGVYAPTNPVRTVIIAWSWGAYLGNDALANGIRTRISSWARHHISVSFSKAKITGQYTNSIMAKAEAKLSGYDEAILMDTFGYVSEGSGENIFVVRRGKVITPPLSCSILEGITRDTVITIAREEGIPVAEDRLTRDELYLADEVFLTGTAAEVTPVREVDDRPIGEGKVGPVTKRIQARFFDVVKGTDARHPEWHTRV
jgi:branched-chain amino acid aminotransferase